jgi:hypothetical protein
MFHYATFRGPGPFLSAELSNRKMKRTTIVTVPVSPFSATPACAFMKLDCAYELAGTQADPTA